MSGKKTENFIGIDVSKKLLEVAVHESEQPFRCPNQASAFPGLLTELIALRPALIVLEATGGLEISITNALHSAGLPVVVINPRQVRDFAKALGQLAKTDRLEARVWAHLAAVIKPPQRPIKSAETQELDALRGRRGQLVGMLTAEKNRRGSAPTDALRDEIEAHIDWLEERIAALDRQLQEHLKRSTTWQRKDDVLPSVPGIGPVVSLSCLAELPSWACSIGNRSVSWLESRRSIVIADNCVAHATSTAVAPMSAACFTWQLGAPSAATPCSKSSTNR